MKILLIDPPFFRIMGFYNRYYPFGLVSLGTSLKQKGHDVVIYDSDSNESPEDIDYTNQKKKYQLYLKTLNSSDHSIWKEVEKTLLDTSPDIVGISVWTTYAASSFKVANISKQIFPNIPVVMGGPHTYHKSDEILKLCPAVDFVFRGESEETFPAFIDQLQSGHPDFSGITGLSYIEDGIIHHNSPTLTRKNLDIFPAPDRTLMMNEHLYTSEDMGLMVTSRGCPYSCTFCATETKRVSYRNIDHIIDEIRTVKEKYGTTLFSFKDDSFMVSRQRVTDLCNTLLESGLKINWQCNARVNNIEPSLLSLMKKSGCMGISIGIESGSERILKMMKKSITLDAIRKAAKYIKQSGIHFTGYFMMGVPGETEEEINATVSLIKELKPDVVSLGIYHPFPGTEMFHEGINQGLVKEHMSLEDYFNTPPNHYFKSDPNIQIHSINPDRYSWLEQQTMDFVHKYNKNILRAVKMARARFSIYIKSPGLFLEDLKKYFSY